MDEVSIRIEGLRELEEKLERMATKDADRIGFESLRAGGQVFQAAVRERAPERPDLPSGNALPPGALAHDIELHLGRSEDGKPAVFIRPGAFTLYVARWVEYGHRLVKGGYLKLAASGKTRGKGREVGNIPAYPFIRPGFEAARDAATKVTCEAIARGVEEAAKK